MLRIRKALQLSVQRPWYSPQMSAWTPTTMCGGKFDYVIFELRINKEKLLRNYRVYLGARPKGRGPTGLD